MNDFPDLGEVPNLNDEVVGSGAEVIDVVKPSVQPTLKGSSHVNLAEMEERLQNFRMRKRLGLLPENSKEPQEEHLRWIRHRHRPAGLAAIEEQGNHPSKTSAAELSGKIADMQHDIDQHYSELNATRRQGAAMVMGIRRQEESLKALGAENSSLKERLDALDFEIKERLARNRQLSVQLTLQRQSEADSSSQPAVLAKSVRQAEAACVRRPVCPALPPPRVVATEGSGAAPSTAALETSIKRIGELAEEGRVEVSLQTTLLEAFHGLKATCPIEDKMVTAQIATNGSIDTIQSYRDHIRVLDAENAALREIIGRSQQYCARAS